jgi:hypothetical protein
VLANNADVIVALEAGFVGAWGEWHSSTHGLDRDQAAKQRILAALLAALPPGRQVALRFPHDIARLVGELPRARVGTDAPTARVGSHQDCFLGSDDDVGTWGFGGRSIDDDKAFIAERARATVVGGETCRPGERATCDEAKDELARLRFSYLNQDFHPEVIARLRKDGCLDEIRARLGYRLEIRDAATAMRKDRLHFEATIRNTGYAAPINPRRAYLVLEADGKRHDLLMRARPRSWAAGEDVALREDLALPDELATGVYSVSLWLPDPAPRLRDRAAYAIRLANQGTWVAASGLNRLGEVLVTRAARAPVVEAPPPAAPIGEGALIVDEFDDAWPSANALGKWSGANSFVDGPRGEGIVARGRLALRYQGAGWFSTLIDRDVSDYRWLVLRVRGRDGGEQRHIGVKFAGVDAPLAKLSSDAIATEYGDVRIDLTSPKFDRRKAATLELYFWRGQPTGRVDLDSIRFER